MVTRLGKRRHKACLAMLLLFANTSLFGETNDISPSVVIAYTYHLKPPNIIDEKMKSGLYFDLLSLISDDEIEYRLAYMPRKRINKLLERGNLEGVIIGVSPHWFSDSRQSKYLWTSAFIEDRDEIISHIDTSFEFRIDTLSDKTMAGVRGLFYVGLNKAVVSGRLERFDTESAEQIIDMVYHQRVDFGVVSRSTLEYLHEKTKYIDSLYISTIPHESYLRHVLVPKHLSPVAAHVNKRLGSQLKTEAWQRMMSQYSLNKRESLSINE